MNFSTGTIVNGTQSIFELLLITNSIMTLCHPMDSMCLEIGQKVGKNASLPMKMGNRHGGNSIF